MRGRAESLIQSTFSGSSSDGVKGSPRASLPARKSARPSQNATCPSTPATLQYSLTMVDRSRSVRRDTSAFIRASSREFSSTNDRSIATSLLRLGGQLVLGRRNPVRLQVPAEHCRRAQRAVGLLRLVFELDLRKGQGERFGRAF